MNAELHAVLDSIEADVDRQRNMAPELKVSMLAKISRVRELANGPTRLMIKPSGKEFSREEWLEASGKVMIEHEDTLRALGVWEKCDGRMGRHRRSICRSAPSATVGVAA